MRIRSFADHILIHRFQLRKSLIFFYYNNSGGDFVPNINKKQTSYWFNANECTFLNSEFAIPIAVKE